MALVRAENQDAMLEPKIMTTAIRSTAMRATSRPYSVTAIPCSERTKRETARTGTSWSMDMESGSHVAPRQTLTCRDLHFGARELVTNGSRTPLSSSKSLSSTVGRSGKSATTTALPLTSTRRGRSPAAVHPPSPPTDSGGASPSVPSSLLVVTRETYVPCRLQTVIHCDVRLCLSRLRAASACLGGESDAQAREHRSPRGARPCEQCRRRGQRTRCPTCSPARAGGVRRVRP